ncbi:MAG TPA: Glu/Leu/Phe/Val dehydrogenase family protein, partial [Candidatus Lustribacter sp.]|nr:Glu/Leu/Phe/Val dehydrogenase family protein [Candidatus Lustribacter sp.]
REDARVARASPRNGTARCEPGGLADDVHVRDIRADIARGHIAAAQHVWGTPTLAGRRVGIAGVGKVGRLLTAHLLDDGADVVVTDVSPAATHSLTQRFPQVEVAPDAVTLCAMAIDVYSPCALGGALDPATVESLQARIVCGGANNQLAVDGPDGTADRLQERGILYAPDFLVNAGGVIQVSDELSGFDFERAKARTAGIFEATARVLHTAAERGLTPAAAADQLAEERMASAAQRGLRLRDGTGSAAPPFTL